MGKFLPLTVPCCVWDKIDKKFYPVRSITMDSNGNLENVVVHKCDFGVEHDQRIFAPLFKIVRYTGIPDKYHRPIKEGDIIKLCLSHFSHLYRDKGEKPPLSDERICTVEIENQTVYLVENEDSVWVLDLMFQGMIKRELASLEIIGNVFENSDLLDRNLLDNARDE